MDSGNHSERTESRTFEGINTILEFEKISIQVNVKYIVICNVVR